MVTGQTTVGEKINMASEKTKPLADDPSLATQTSGKGTGAYKHIERISRLSECKQHSQQMAEYLTELTHRASDNHAKVLRKILARLKGCANYLLFHNYYTIDQIRLAKVTTCQMPLLCAFCSRSKAGKMLEKYLERFKLLISENPSLKPALLTMTITHSKESELMERFLHLSNSWKKYQSQRRDWKKKGWGFNELCKVDGAVFRYEVTNKHGNGWHPHLHSLVLLNNWIDQKQIVKEWKKITGDSDIVDIRRIKGKTDDELIKSFQEVFKYTLKFSEMTLADTFQAYETLKGKRLQGSFGSFWGVKIPEEITDDLFEDLPYLEMLYRYRKNKGFNLENVESVSLSRKNETVTG